MKKLFGVVTPMVTPFLENGEVDTEALKKLTSKLVKQGINGLYPCGTTGEGHLLSLEERMLVAKTVVDEAAGRVPVYVQTGFMSLKDTVMLSKHALEIGADGLGVVTPSYYSLSQKAIRNFYVSLANEMPEDFPIYLYTIPECTGNDILPATAKEIADACANVIGIKYSGDDFTQMQGYMQIRDGKFSVLSGNDRTFASVLASGCDGTVSGLSNLFGDKLVELYKKYTDGDLEGAVELQNDVFTSSLCLFEGYFLAHLKAAIGIKGMPVGTVRSPLPQLTDIEYSNLKKALV